VRELNLIILNSRLLLIVQVLQHDEHFPGRERDESEIKGYYAALKLVKDLRKHSNDLFTKCDCTKPKCPGRSV
jgi:hypothetical protein